MNALQALRTLAIAANAKIHKNRRKQTKWSPNLFNALGERIWKKPEEDGQFQHYLQNFLTSKLREEFNELLQAVHFPKEGPSADDPHGVFWEAADVTAMAMMVADSQDTIALQPKVVCLCGSTRFKDAFMEANLHETMLGNIVLSVGFFMHAEGKTGETTEATKNMLDELHKRKIDLADEILVLNVNGYIGSSTNSEISYAHATGKPVRYLVPIQYQGARNEQ